MNFVFCNNFGYFYQNSYYFSFVAINALDGSVKECQEKIRFFQQINHKGVKINWYLILHIIITEMYLLLTQ